MGWVSDRTRERGGRGKLTHFAMAHVDIGQLHKLARFNRTGLRHVGLGPTDSPLYANHPQQNGLFRPKEQRQS